MDSEDDSDWSVDLAGGAFPGRAEPELRKFALHDAVESGDADRLKILLYPAGDGVIHTRAGHCFMARDVLGCHPLHVAILHGRVECAEVLLTAGASAISRCDGNPALHMAVCLAMHPGYEEAALKLVRLLLQHDAHVQLTDDTGRNALHWACVVGLTDAIPLLLDAAKRAEAELLETYTKAQEGQRVMGPDGVEVIIKADIPEPEPVLEHLVTLQDNDGHTPLALAVRHGSVGALQTLLSGAAAGEGPAAWDVAGLCGTKRMGFNKDGHTPLHLAALHNQPGAARVLLSAVPACGSIQDRKGRTADALADKRGHKVLASALKAALEGQSGTASLWDAAVQAADAGKQDDASGSRGRQPRRCLLLSPVECLMHRTAPEPLRRGASPPPPENVHRLKVLVTPDSGVLRSKEFSDIPWRTAGLPSVTMNDVLRCHEWSYIRNLLAECQAIPDTLDAIGHLDGDTAICHHSAMAAFKAAGACCAAVDDVMAGQARTAFCAVRPPGHHAGPIGVVHSTNKGATGSHGFCLLSNVAIAAGYAMSMYRHQGVKRVAILDFDVHHGNGTEAVVANVVPSVHTAPLNTPFSTGHQLFPLYKPWLDASDKDNIFFASVQGYGRHPLSTESWFYPGSGATHDTRSTAPPAADSAAQQPAALQPPVKAEANATTTTTTTGAGGAQDVVSPAGGVAAAGAGASTGAGAAAGAASGGVAGAGVQEVYPEDPDGEFAASTRDSAHEGGIEGPHQGAAGPRIINVGVPGPGTKRFLWKRAWRDKILPAVANFKPDFIFVSAGFDAHKKEALNLRYVGVTEADYEWLTDQIKQLANRFCGGRIVSVLEGGYNLHGGCMSTFARSVAAHVRTLSEDHNQEWDPLESQMERQAEAAKRLAAAQAAAEKAAAAEQAAAEAAAKAAEAAAARAAEAAAAAKEGPADMEVDAAAGPSQPVAAVTPEEDSGRAKRARRGGVPVDYVALNAQIEAEKAAKAAAAQQQK